ncbi:hypothetical protein L1887_50896 [Cichorium endivia]|nr:hypothetical protein L1887_50896 [Cichorium endivia]
MVDGGERKVLQPRACIVRRVAAGRVRTEKVEAERVLVATVTAQLHCGAAAVKKKVSQRRACLVRIEARGRDLSLCASPPYANIDPSGSTLKLRSAAQLSSKCWTFPAPLVCCFAHAGFLDARRGGSRDSKSEFRSNMLKFCTSLSTSSPAATYPSLQLATLPLVRNTEHSHEGSTHLLLDAEDISDGKIDASGYKGLLLVLVLFLVVCVAVGSLLHDGERTTLGGTADHLLLDAGGDGGGLLLLGLGRLHCRLLLGSDDTSWTAHKLRADQSRVSLWMFWPRRYARAGGHLEATRGPYRREELLTSTFGAGLGLGAGLGRGGRLLRLGRLESLRHLELHWSRIKRWWWEAMVSSLGNADSRPFSEKKEAAQIHPKNPRLGIRQRRATFLNPAESQRRQSSTCTEVGGSEPTWSPALARPTLLHTQPSVSPTITTSTGQQGGDCEHIEPLTMGKDKDKLKQSKGGDADEAEPPNFYCRRNPTIPRQDQPRPYAFLQRILDEHRIRNGDIQLDSSLEQTTNSFPGHSQLYDEPDSIAVQAGAGAIAAVQNGLNLRETANTLAETSESSATDNASEHDSTNASSSDATGAQAEAAEQEEELPWFSQLSAYPQLRSAGIPLVPDDASSSKMSALNAASSKKRATTAAALASASVHSLAGSSRPSSSSSSAAAFLNAGSAPLSRVTSPKTSYTATMDSLPRSASSASLSEAVSLSSRNTTLVTPLTSTLSSTGSIMSNLITDSYPHDTRSGVVSSHSPLAAPMSATTTTSTMSHQVQRSLPSSLSTLPGAGISAANAGAAAPPDFQEDLLPPDNFAMVNSHVYRSSFPKKKHFPFLRTLGLRSVLTLILEEYPETNASFLDQNGITFFHSTDSGRFLRTGRCCPLASLNLHNRTRTIRDIEDALDAVQEDDASDGFHDSLAIWRGM